VNVSRKGKIIVGAAAALAVGGAGAGIAATRLGRSPGEESKAVVSDAAKQLGVQPSELSAALKKALENRVDRAVADGRMSKARGEALKRRIESNDFPLFGPPGFRPHRFGDFGPFERFGHHGHFRPAGLPVAASYLGLTVAELRAKLDSGKTLAAIAKDEGKSVDGLVAGLKADLRKHLDEAVSAGRLTRAQADRVLSEADEHIRAFVEGTFPPPGRGRGWFHPRPPVPGLGMPPA
jgi:polyhydroxyalkanoate synthesis regulator phasin